jgi:hypothetical protein
LTWLVTRGYSIITGLVTRRFLFHKWAGHQRVLNRTWLISRVFLFLQRICQLRVPSKKWTVQLEMTLNCYFNFYFSHIFLFWNGSARFTYSSLFFWRIRGLPLYFWADPYFAFILVLVLETTHFSIWLAIRISGLLDFWLRRV